MKQLFLGTALLAGAMAFVTGKEGNMKHLFLGTALLSGAMAFAQAPDNSRVNRRNAGEHAISSERQSNSKTNLELVRKIRIEIAGRETFSTFDRNVKIVTGDGVAHLRDPVKTATSALSQLEVSPEKKATAAPGL